MTRRDWLAALIGAIQAMFGRRVTPKECEEWFGAIDGEGGGLYQLAEPLTVKGDSPFFGVNRGDSLRDLHASRMPGVFAEIRYADGRADRFIDNPPAMMHPREFEKGQRWWRENG